MIFEQIRVGGCLSYLLGCPETHAAVLIDPELSQLDNYRTLAAHAGLRLHYIIETHTHADHFSAAQVLAKEFSIPVVMHSNSPAPYVGIRVNDREMLVVGQLKITVHATPGHTKDSICLQVGDSLFTGDTLLIEATGRTDLPGGDPDQLYDSLFGRVLSLDPGLKVYPAHDYKQRVNSTLAEEIKNNPRLQKRERQEFIAMMNNLNLAMPTHVTEALRTNISGGKTVAQLLSDAAEAVPFMSQIELKNYIDAGNGEILIVDVREPDAYQKSHIAGAISVPRGQLELRVDKDLPDPTRRIITCCELGKISTLAAYTLRQLGFQKAIALEGGVQQWRDSGYPMD